MKDIIIFGAVERKSTEYLINIYKNRIICFVDNDSKKKGKSIYDQPILDPSEIKNNSNAIIIVNSYTHYKEIKTQILNYGHPSTQITSCLDISEINSYEFWAFQHGISIEKLEPRWLNLELSGICNLKCFYCPFHGKQNIKKGQKKLMKWNTLYKVIEQIQRIPSLCNLSTCGAGEIFVNPEWYEMLTYIIEHTSFELINIYTNGMMLNKDNIEKLLSLNIKKIEIEISIDGESAEENDLFRIGSKYDIIREHVYFLQNVVQKRKLGNKVKIIITNCYPYNGVVPNEFYSKAGKVPEFLIRDFPDINIVSQYTFFDKDEKAVDIQPYNIKKVKFPNNSPIRCTNLFDWIAINNMGELIRCSCGHPGVSGIANVFNDDIFQVWKNDSVINEARKNFICGIETQDMCGNCPGKGNGEYYIVVR